MRLSRETPVLVFLIAVASVASAGCSFVFVRSPTPEVAREKGSCEGRGVAVGADGVLTALALIQLAGSSSTSASIGGAGLASNDVTLRSTPWLSRNGDVVWPAVATVTFASMLYGLAKTAQCSQMRKAAAPPTFSPGGAGAVRPMPMGIRTAPAPVPPGYPSPSAPNPYAWPPPPAPPPAPPPPLPPPNPSP